LIAARTALPEAAPAPGDDGTFELDPRHAEWHPLDILLVEDNPVNQKLALRMLARMGYEADLAANGREAVQAVERRRYDLVLMDIQMPEMDGLEATGEIVARIPQAERPWIVAMTANAMDSDRQQCLDAGMNSYLAKPIQVEEFVAAVLATPVAAEEA
jgi:CheY-like chemotaxis protein